MVNILKELWAKAIHLMILLVVVGYSAVEKHSGKQVALVALICLFLVFLALEYLRLELNWKMEFYSLFVRPKEQHRMIGSVYFLLSAIIALAVFDKRIAIAALLMAAFGDSIAAIVGKMFGTSLIYKNKTWAGAISELIVSLIVGFAVLSSIYNIYVILGMALTATIAETLVDELDDNLITPVAAGFIGQIIKFAF